MTNEKQSSEPQTDSVFKAVSAMEIKPDEQFLQTLRQRSAQAFQTAAADHLNTTNAGHSENLWRTIMHNRIIRFSAVAAVICAATLGVIFFNQTESTAYANVVQMLQQLRTLTYTLTTQVNDGSGSEISTRWLYKDPSYLRTETEGGHVTIIDGTQGTQMSLIPENMTYLIGKFEMTDKADDGPFATIANLRTLPAQADEYLGEQEFDTGKAEGFRVTVGDASTTVWIDVKTRALVRVEQAYADAPGMNYTMDDISLDEEIEDTLFSLTPPPEFTQSVTLDAGTGGSEEQFVEFLRFWSTELTQDNTFPPVVLGPQMSKVMIDMVKQGKFHQEKLMEFDQNETYQALLWLANLPKESNWRYLGENVTYGDPAQPIFWYRTAGDTNYRVIYADLHIEEVLPEDLPQ